MPARRPHLAAPQGNIKPRITELAVAPPQDPVVLLAPEGIDIGTQQIATETSEPPKKAGSAPYFKALAVAGALMLLGIIGQAVITDCCENATVAPTASWFGTPPLDVPLDHSAVLTFFTHGSCADQHKPQHVWRTLNATRPDLFVFNGDIV